MDYEKMWLSLKKIVEEEIDMYAGDPENTFPYFRGQADEADYLLWEMKILESTENCFKKKRKRNIDEHAENS